MTRFRIPVLISGAILILTVLISSGCSAPQELTQQRAIIGQQVHQIDSLQAINAELYAELRVLRDSLQFIDDIRSGQFYRDMRLLNDRIAELEFEMYQRTRGITVASLPADELYQPASAELTTRGTELLAALADLVQDRFQEYQLRVEGHADPTPLGPDLIEKYGSNWGLSAARAARVVRYLLEEEAVDSSRIAAAAYGASRPIATNETREGRRQNRRVRVAALPLDTDTTTVEVQ